MSGPLEDVVKRWTTKRKSALVIEIIQDTPWTDRLRRPDRQTAKIAVSSASLT